MVATAFASLLLCAADPMPPRADDADQRLNYLISRLDVKVDRIDGKEIALSKLLEMLPKLTAEHGFEKNPELQFRITVDVKSFERSLQMPVDLNRLFVRFDRKIRNEPLSVVLQTACDQLDGAYVIRRNHIEVIPLDLLRKELHIRDTDENSFFPLVHWIGTDVPLDQALRHIDRRYQTKFVISAAAKEKAKAPVTARLLNSPAEAAVESLAAAAGLQVVRRANVLLVTTKEESEPIKTKDRKLIQEEEKERQSRIEWRRQPFGVFPQLGVELYFRGPQPNYMP